MAVEITEDFVWQVIPPRPRESHKGTFGTVLAVAGSASYRGAALLAAEGALRTGAGIVTLASVEPVLAAAAARLPECCLCPCAAGAEGGISPESIPFIQRQKATVLLLGPGLGGTAQSAARAAETRTLVQKLLPGFAGSAVLDADGLNAAAQLLAEGKALPHPTGELILTPHPGEMARLTGLSVAEISTDREKIARQYAKKWNVVVVLKGSRTIVAAPDGRACVNLTGNPARLPECCLCPCAAGAEGGISPESIPFIQRQKATVLLLGPGLGGTAQSAARAAETRTLVQKLLPGFAGSAVLDADGLNAAAQLLAEGKALPHPTGELILTPHPGEMARLTGLSAAEINADREKIARQYAKKWNVVVVLKGSHTVVAAPDGRACVNPTGNPGLARGGSGDVLAGMTAALLACRLPAFEAASCAVYLHGAAADRAAALCGEYGMLPHDILPQLGRMFAENQR